jgi:cell division cycle protein 37
LDCKLTSSLFDPVFQSWKRRDIHEKRERRRQLIANLRGEIALNNILKPRLESLRSRISADPSAGLSVFSGEVHRLKTNPSPDKPPTGHAKQPTYDEMLLDLLLRVRTAAVNSADGDKVDVSKLVEQLEFHEKELDNRSEECEKQAHAEEMEQKKKITSEDVHEGFDVGVSK